MNWKVHPAIATVLILSLLAAPREAGAATTITVCQTLFQSGPYVLDNNLTAMGHCLRVFADFVTIDLNGFTIRGNGTGAGITGEDFRGTTVRNGTITNFADGIALGLGASRAMVEGMRVMSNLRSGITVGTGSTVTRNTVTNNAGPGISVGTASTVTGNIASDNGQGGISADSGSLVRGNIANANRSVGILVLSGSTVTGNVATSPSGIVIYAACPSNVMGNTAWGGRWVSLFLFGPGCHSVDNVAR